MNSPGLEVPRYVTGEEISAAVCRLSLVAASGGCSLVSRHALLIAEASLAAEHRF